MNLYSDYELLDDSLASLRMAFTQPARKAAAVDIKQHIESAARELSIERFAAFEHSLFETIFDLIVSETVDHRKGAVMALKELTDATSSATEKKIVKVANTLSLALMNNSEMALVDMLAEAIGYVSKYSVVTHIEYVEKELGRSLEWLRDPLQQRRFAACAVLNRLADSAPTVFFARSKEFFDLIWGPLRDGKYEIRIAAARALSACLAMLKQRSHHLQSYCSVYEQICVGLNKKSKENCHGSLIVIVEMLRHTDNFMLPRFREVCSAVFRLKDHSSRTVRSAIISLIPELASYCPETFTRSYLNEAVDILSVCSRNIDLKPQVLISIGRLCNAAGDQLVYKVPVLTAVVREALTKNPKKEVFVCISDMVVGLGPIFHEPVIELLDLMLKSGLSPDLIDTLAVVAAQVVQYQAVIQRKLVAEVFKILGWNTPVGRMEGDIVRVTSVVAIGTCWTRSKGKKVSSRASESRSPIQQDRKRISSNSVANVGAGRSSSSSSGTVSVVGYAEVSGPEQSSAKKLLSHFMRRSQADTRRFDPANRTADPDSQSPDLVLLCLKTLGTLYTPSIVTEQTMMNIYNFLLPMVQNSVLPYLDSSDARVREEAASTAANLITTPAEALKIRGPVASVIEEIINRLLQSAVSDMASTVRLAVLKCLRSPLDYYLSQEHHIESIMFLLADEVLDVRIEALTLLGRLAPYNPSKVLPGCRQILLHVIGDIRSSSDNRTKEEATLLLCHFLRASSLQMLVKSFMVMLIRAVLPTATHDTRLTTAGLEAMGELCLVMRTEIVPFVEVLLPVIISNMYNSASLKKQETAIRTLGQLVSAVGLVIKPYLRYPELMSKSLGLLRFSPWSLRCEVLRTLGLLGALEPYKFGIIQEHLILAEGRRVDSDGPIMGRAASQSYGGALALALEHTPALIGTGALWSNTESDQMTKRDRADSGNSSLTGTGRKNSLDTESSRTDTPSGSGKSFELVLEEDNADLPVYLFMYEQNVMRAQCVPDIEEKTRLTPTSEDYYPRTSISALMRILRDPSLSMHHSATTHALMLIFRSLGSRSVSYLGEVLPYLLSITHNCSHGLRESIIQQLTQLAIIVKYHLAPYLPNIFDIICAFWSEHLEYILHLVEEIARSAPDEIVVFLPRLMPLLLSTLVIPKNMQQQSDSDFGENSAESSSSHSGGFYYPASTQSSQMVIQAVASIIQNPSTSPPPVLILRALESTLLCIDGLCVMLKSQSHLVIPQLCKLIGQLCDIGQESLPKLLLAVNTLRKVCDRSSIDESSHLASRVIHCLVRVMTWLCSRIWGMESSKQKSSGFILSFGSFSKEATQSMDMQAAVSPSVITVGKLGYSVIAGLFTIGVQLKHRFLTFEGLLRKTFNAYPISSALSKLDELNEMIRNGEVDRDDRGCDVDVFLSQAKLLDFSSSYDPLSAFSLVPPGQCTGVSESLLMERSNREVLNRNVATLTASRVHVNQVHLQRAWSVAQRSTAGDWNEWIKRLTMEMLRESSSPCLRSCSAMVQSYPPLGRELFQAAFVSCWQDLSDDNQESLVKALQVAFSSQSIPPEILQQLLNLAEYMEHDFVSLPIAPSILAELAQKSHAYAKALHYREMEFQSSPATCFESLININKKLDQYDAAIGVLKVVLNMQGSQKHLGDGYTIQESWLAKLGQWNEALIRYDHRLEINPTERVALLGKLKCLDALGRWDEAVTLCIDKLEILREESPILEKAAVIGARAAWSLNEWGLLESLVEELPTESTDASIMRAVLKIHTEDYSSARQHIDSSRRKLSDTLITTLSESYSRAYVPLIKVQQCSELEEIIEFKMLLKSTGSGEPGPHQPQTDDVDGDNDDPLNTSASFKAHLQNLNQLSAANLSPLGAVPSSSERSLRGARAPSVRNLASMLNLQAEASTTPMSASASTPGQPIFRSMSEDTSALPRYGNTSSASLSGAGGTGSQQQQQQSSTSVYQDIARRKSFLAEKWRKRIKGCKSSGRAAIGVWKNLLDVRRLVLEEKEDLDIWLEFSTLCRHGGNLDLAERVLRLIHTRSEASPPSSISHRPGSFDMAMMDNPYFAPSNLFYPTSLADCKIRFAVLRLRWSTGDREEAVDSLAGLIDHMSSGTIDLRENIVRSGSGSGSGSLTRTPTPSLGTPSTTSSSSSLYLDCLLKLGQWKLSLLPPSDTVDTDTRQEVLSLYSKATVMSPGNYRAWHEWGLANYRAAEEMRERGGGRRRHQSWEEGSSLAGMAASLQNVDLDTFVVHAAKGLLRAISLGTRRFASSVSQDMLSLLSVWFRYGQIPDVYAAIDAGISTVVIDNWLGVLPQLIARIDHPEINAQKLLHTLIARLGSSHAQALVYPLSVAVKSPRPERREAAESLMSTLRSHSEKLIDQALLVSQELIRIAILWEEIWHEVLEEASRLYFGESNIQAMLDMLLPRHDMLATGPMTLREASFVQFFGNELNGAYESLKKYMSIMATKGQTIPNMNTGPLNRKAGGAKSEEDAALGIAWEIYYSVFKKINVALTNINSLELSNVSPNLVDCRNLALGVPGTYSVSGAAVRIVSFKHSVQVIKSKQRPRKLTVHGEDGNQYVFFIKGHEDLRQDERAMQLFGLVNALLYYDRQTQNDDLDIQRYAVIPLSPTVGLIAWVPHCDTLHDLIKDYRESRSKNLLNIEHKLMQQLSPSTGYEMLTHAQKLEVFEYALQNTNGEDLAKILWHRSETSEAWLQRRGNYTRSLAVMSMVGYILGLGDRHPSNVMLNRITGKILHIDFGDCFEVAMKRDKFPEKVPFRLTRMLVNAMEVSGIEGSYRLTCEKVMFVLRENRDSLIAMLEAFVYDPLMSWRLQHVDRTTKEQAHAGQRDHQRVNPLDMFKPKQKKAGGSLVCAVTAPTVKPFVSDRGLVAAELSPRHNVVGPVVESGFRTLQDPKASVWDGATSDPSEGSLPSVRLGTSVPMRQAAPNPPPSSSITSGSPYVIPPPQPLSPKKPLQPPPLRVLLEQVDDEQMVDELAGQEQENVTIGGVESSTDIADQQQTDVIDFHREIVMMAASLHQGGTLIAASLQHSKDGSRPDMVALARSTLSSVVRTLSEAESIKLQHTAAGTELRNKAVGVVRRVVQKLNGLDFSTQQQGRSRSLRAHQPLAVEEQVDKLIAQASSNENLCLSYIGWCPFW